MFCNGTCPCNASHLSAVYAGMAKEHELQHAVTEHPAMPLKNELQTSGRSSGGSRGEGAGPLKPATPRQDAMSKTLQSLEAEHLLSNLLEPSSSDNAARPSLRAVHALKCSKPEQDVEVAKLEGRALQASSSSSSEEDAFESHDSRRPSHPGEAFQRLKDRRWSATQEGRRVATPQETAAVQVGFLHKKVSCPMTSVTNRAALSTAIHYQDLAHINAYNLKALQLS